MGPDDVAEHHDRYLYGRTFGVGQRVELYATILAPDGGSIESGTRAIVRAIDSSRSHGADHLVAFMENERPTGLEVWLGAEDLLPA